MTKSNGTDTVIFLFGTTAVGAVMRLLFKGTSIPYTVIMIITGLVFGSITNQYEELQSYTKMARMDPHLMLYVFLPTLIFESAFVMDVHILKRVFSQILLLAGPGMMLGATMTAAMVRMTFSTYAWSWWTCLMFGSIMGATDPVAVVALLRELGASPRLATMMEGESLLNDGAAIVMFTVLLELCKGGSYTGAEVVLQFLRVAIGGPLFGWLAGKITVKTLASVFNDALIEITVTVSAAFITFYVAEAVLGVSGVCASAHTRRLYTAERIGYLQRHEFFLHPSLRFCNDPTAGG
eukprot:m.1490213 g.1490213  ORF g.1490213 m.1490213 type:complete len:294 (+) comp25190_c0_seq55:665-1546(+)